MIDYKDPKFQSWARKVHAECIAIGMGNESRITKLFSEKLIWLNVVYNERESPIIAAGRFMDRFWPKDYVTETNTKYIEEMLRRREHGQNPRAARIPPRQSFANVGKEYLDLISPKTAKGYYKK